MATGNESLSALERAEEMLTRAEQSLREAAPQLLPAVQSARQHVVEELIARERERLLKGEEAA